MCFVSAADNFVSYVLVSREHSKGNETVPETVATTCTEDGHKQTTKTSTAIQTKWTKEHRTTVDEMEGPTSS